MSMRTLIYKTSALLFAATLMVPSAQGQASDPIKDGKVYFINQLMREVVIPANNPDDPDVIPVGYRAELPDTSAARVAQRGDHFWLFTTEVVDRNNLYEAWVAEGRPRPAVDFARERIAEEEFVVDEEPPEPAPEPEPVPEETTAAAEPEATGWSGAALLIGALVLAALLAAAYMWQKRRGEAA